MDDVDFQRKLVEEVKVPKEALNNHRMGGLGGVLWLQPHNCRVYYGFTGSGYGLGKPINSGSEHLTETDLFDVRVKKKTIEIFYKGFGKQWFMIRREDKLSVATYLKGLVLRECSSFIFKWGSEHGLSVDLEPLRNRTEVGERGDFSRIPKGLSVNWVDFKKVYTEDKGEWTSWEALENSAATDLDVLASIKADTGFLRGRLAWEEALERIFSKAMNLRDVMSFKEDVELVPYDKRGLILEHYILRGDV